MAQHLPPHRIREIYDVVFALVAEHGYANVRIDQIAKAAHTSTATIYRHWGSKSKLVVGVLTADTHDEPDIDTGSLLGDLHAHVDAIGDDLPAAVRFLTSIALAASDDEELSRSYREHGVPVIRHSLDAAIERAITRGELAADHPAIAHLVPLLLAPHVVTRLLLMVTVTPADTHAYIDSVIPPLLQLTPSPKAH